MLNNFKQLDKTEKAGIIAGILLALTFLILTSLYPLKPNYIFTIDSINAETGEIHGKDAHMEREFIIYKSEMPGAEIGDKFTVKTGKEEDDILEITLTHKLKGDGK